LYLILQEVDDLETRMQRSGGQGGQASSALGPVLKQHDDAEAAALEADLAKAKERFEAAKKKARRGGFDLVQGATLINVPSNTKKESKRWPEIKTPYVLYETH
jgi:hypothetical protein